jgi:hypothetical protein
MFTNGSKQPSDAAQEAMGSLFNYLDKVEVFIDDGSCFSYQFAEYLQTLSIKLT